MDSRCCAHRCAAARYARGSNSRIANWSNPRSP